jgi:hypothetical protein
LKLRRVAVEEGSVLAEIGAKAFNCSGLQAFNVPPNVTVVCERCFQKCTLLEAVRIAASVTAIGAKCFASCTKLGNVEFEEGPLVTEIGARAFACSGLQRISFPEKVAVVGKGCFNKCTLFKGFDCEGTELAVLPESCFAETNITALHTPSHIREIGDACFPACKRLKVLTIQVDTCLVTLERTAFAETRPKEVTVPPSGWIAAHSLSRQRLLYRSRRGKTIGKEWILDGHIARTHPRDSLTITSPSGWSISLLWNDPFCDSFGPIRITRSWI